jgi:hypothetical protein
MERSCLLAQKIQQVAEVNIDKNQISPAEFNANGIASPIGMKNGLGFAQRIFVKQPSPDGSPTRVVGIPSPASNVIKQPTRNFIRPPESRTATNRLTRSQEDFLEDIPPPKPSPISDPDPASMYDLLDQPNPTASNDIDPKRGQDQDELLPPPPTNQQRMQDAGPKVNPPDVPSPSDRSLRDEVPSDSEDEESLLPRKSPNDLLLEQREQQSKPYPKPDFSTPSEKVIPIPVTPAPDDFKGFGPDRHQTPELPAPRRLYPLPQVERIQPPNVPAPSPAPLAAPGQLPNSAPEKRQFSGQQNAPSDPLPMQNEPWIDRGTMWNSYGNQAGAFRSLMEHGSSRKSKFGSRLESTQMSDQMVDAPNTPHGQSSGLRDRLSDRRWQLGQSHQRQLSHQLPLMPESDPLMDRASNAVAYQPYDFSPIPTATEPLDAQREIQTYNGKLAVDTQRPWVEWWRPFYTGGMYDPGVPVFSDVNLLTPSFLVYGDYRTGVGVHRNNGKDVRSWAHRLNLDMDLRFTSTERFHLFTGPLDHNGKFTRLDFSNNPPSFEAELDFQPDTAFFEGDLGAMTGGWLGQDAPFDLPFTCGLVPLLFQNGIWMEDAIAGFAIGNPWKHNRALNISNYDATFFAGFNQVTSPAFQNDNNAAAVYGTAWFLEAYNGYVEADYAYLDDLDNQGRSYHNAAIAYTRRYFGRISNSVRLIGNAGQSGPANTRTADGGLLLIENSLISAQPSNVVPYWNFFAGSGRPQSVARAANAGGILRNTGINFETDGLTGYPTLAATGSNSYGGAIGINVLSADFRKQWIGEFAALDTFGDPLLGSAAGPQYALGTRYQRALNNRSIWRVDFINGWLDRASDIYGMRTEFRWKF